MKISIPRFDARGLTEKMLVESRINQGEITTIDSADIPNSAVTVALNARCKLDKISRRSGKTDDSPVKPNSNKILGIVLFKKNNNSRYFLRFTKNSIHERTALSWTNYIAGTGGSLTGGDFDYFSLAVVLNKLFSANGVDKLQVIDVATAQYTEAGANSPKVKYVTGFADRVVGAYRVEATEPDGPVSIVWSANRNSTKWPNDAVPDESCGQSPLVESTSDLADFITGIFGGPNILMISREKSIWVGTKQPIASNPFNLMTALPGIGSDCPNSIEVIPGGLAFMDTRTAQVWVWAVGSVPEEIGTEVFDDIIKGVSNPAHVFSGYDTVAREYSIGVPIAGTTVVKVWTRNFRTKSWVHDEIDSLSYISDIESPFSTVLTFDDLAGSFDALVGSFDSLGITSPDGKAARYYGYGNGDLFVEDTDKDTDASLPYTTDIQSKDFKSAGVELYFTRIEIEYKARRVGDIVLSYSEDQGESWIVIKTTETKLGKSRRILYTKAIKARQLRWRITATDGLFDILEYDIKVAPVGEAPEEK